MSTSVTPQKNTQAAGTDFGITLQTIAASLSLSPVDVALSTAAMLGGIAGPLAGVKDPFGRRITPGINLLKLPGTEARVRALQGILTHPVRTAQHAMRRHAGRMMKSVVDASAYGLCGAFEKAPDELMQHPGARENHKQRTQQAIETVADGFHFTPINEDPTPSGPILPDFSESHQPVQKDEAFRHPSVMLENVNLAHITSHLAEVLDQHGLLLDPHGTALRQVLSSPKRCRSTMDQLCRLLEGSDISLPRFHKEQGYGTLKHAKIQILSSLSVEVVSELLLSQDHSGHPLLAKCLLWTPAQYQCEHQPTATAREQAWLAYRNAVNGILHARAGGRGPVQELHEDSVPAFAKWQDRYMNFLSGELIRFQHLLGELHDLPARLLWAFMLLYKPGEKFWCLKAAFATAEIIARRHYECLIGLENQAKEQGVRRLAERLFMLCQAKGALTYREIARSSNVQSRLHLMPALDLLEQEGKVSLNERGHYHVNPANTAQSSAAISNSLTAWSAN